MFKCNSVTLVLKSGREIVKDLNITLNNDDKLAIIGEEGNGKSTLIKYFYNEEIIDDYCFYNGIKNISKNKIGYIPQSMDKRWFDYNIEEFFLKDEIDGEYNYDIYNELYKVEKLFTKFGLAIELLNDERRIGSLSGGEKLKIQLIKILLRKPELYLFDEPTNDLDLESLELLEEFMIETHEPLIFISHDEELLSSVSNMILHLEQIKRKSEMKFTLEKLNYDDYVELRNRNIDKQNMAAYRTSKEKERKRQILLRQHTLVANDLNRAVRQPSWGRILAKKMANIKAQEKRLDKMEVIEKYVPEESINIFFEDDIYIPNKKVILDIKDFKLAIDNNVLSFNINFNLTGAKKVAIVGANGVGKTTFIKEVLKMLNNVNNISVGYMPQNYDELIDTKLTPVSYLQSYLGYDKEIKSKIMNCLGALNFVEYEMINNIESLSGGQRAKLYLIKLVLSKNNVLILDEPTRNLSPLSTPVIRKILKDFKGTILAVTHDRKFIKESFDEVYELRKNGLIKII